MDDFIIKHVKARRNKIVSKKGKYTAQERELQVLLIAYAESTGANLAELEDATDKNKFYASGEVI